ncbi:MAG: glycogen synthase GlgA [Gammaproteobacteria bacterium]|jgi:starch synthase
MDILFACSEAHPLVKTGGLADVAGSLPRAIRNLKQEIRLVMPAYPRARDAAGSLKSVAELILPGASLPVRVLQGWLPHTRVRLYLVDAPEHFDRPGGPYSTPEGTDWPDNAARFALFGRAVCEIAMDRAGLAWKPDLVHCNDWQTGLVAALLSTEPQRPATLFTIHNLAYQGLFSHAQLRALGLPPAWWSIDGLEFHGRLSFIKGGLVFADWLTTVSPSYAREIQTAEFGCGLEGLLRHRNRRLTGILNGVDYQHWHPGRDRLIPHNYTGRTLARKLENKVALQKAFDLPIRTDVPLLGHVGRLVEQKGVDLLLELIPQLVQRSLQLVVLGTGQPQLEVALRRASQAHSSRIGVRIAYDEGLAHLIEAGSDAFVMPSRFEPCGLNQLYSLRYGTPPIVHRTGGLADTVVDADAANLRAGRATGFVFDRAQSAALLHAIDRAVTLYAQQELWRGLVRTGMRQDFSWARSASGYLQLYQRLAESRRNGREAPSASSQAESSETSI